MTEQDNEHADNQNGKYRPLDIVYRYTDILYVKQFKHVKSSQVQIKHPVLEYPRSTDLVLSKYSSLSSNR